jgi:hypothetical protein
MHVSGREAIVMDTRATGSMELKSWDEQAFHELDGGPKLSRASVNTTFRGEIEGEGRKEYLMIYHGDESVSFVGLERVVGRIGDRSGSFVLRHDGVVTDGAAKAAVSVVAGSGTGALFGLRGEGDFLWVHGQSGAITLDYEIE